MPVALVGVACRFPGGKDTEEFWVTLSTGVDGITRVPVDRWDADELHGALCSWSFAVRCRCRCCQQLRRAEQAGGTRKLCAGILREGCRRSV